MNIFDRLKNLWLISEVLHHRTSEGDIVSVFEKHLEEKPRMAQIIKRSDPLKEFLTEDKQNG